MMERFPFILFYPFPLKFFTKECGLIASIYYTEEINKCVFFSSDGCGSRAA